MGKSKTGGVFGLLRGKVGSVSYSVVKDRATSKKMQVVRALPESVTNPNSDAQIMQRMKAAPAQRFYTAFESMVANGLLSHSFEGVKYGNDSRLHFLSLAMKDAGPYIPKNATRFIPAAYVISQGTLGSYTNDYAHFGNNPATSEEGPRNIDLNVHTLTAADVTLISETLGVAEGSQISIVSVGFDGDVYVPAVTRFILSAGQEVVPPSETLLSFGTSDEQAGRDKGFFIKSDGTDPVAIAVIVSRQDAAGKWLRSNERLKLTDTVHANLYSAAALQDALRSYQTANTLNALNSQWYLNLANYQAFNGKIVAMEFLTEAGSTETVSLLCGIQSEGNSLTYTIFTADGALSSAPVDASGNAVVGVTAQVVQDINEQSIEVATFKSAYLSQAGF